ASLHPQSRQIDPRRHADALLEHARKMIGREPRFGCQLVEADVLRKPCPHQLYATALCPGGEAALCGRKRSSAQPTQFGEYLEASSPGEQTGRQTLFLTYRPQVLKC